MSIRTDRRRLLLADELLNASTEDLPSASEPLPAVARGRYASAAERDNQPRMIDFVPLRPWSMSLTIGLGVLLIATLLVAHAWLERLAGIAPRAALASLDLTTERSLANWFASLLLLANMQLSLVIYLLRRHRVDDYHGRYRIWLWIAIASLFASIELATDVSSLLKAALSPAARLCGVAEQIGMLVVLGGLICYLAVRTVLETRRSPATLCALLLAGSMLAAPAAINRGMFDAGTPQSATLLNSGLQLSGCLMLLIAAMFYSRHVMLDVEGKLLPPKAKQPKPKPAKKPRARKVKTDLDSPVPTTKSAEVIVDPPQKPKPHLPARSNDSPLGAKAAAAAKAVASSKSSTSSQKSEDSSADEDEDDDKTTDLRSLSRVERKRLKREAKLARR